jgi:uncharacterized protein (TIGR02996 family)
VEERLRQAVLAEPHSPAPRLVYADWLEENGSPLAVSVRAEAELVALPGRYALPAEQLRPFVERLLQVVRSNAGVVLGGWEHAPTLARLRAKMEQLRAADVNCELIGSSLPRYRLLPPLAEAELLERELELGCLLPSEYRAFVLRVCNGVMGPGDGLQSCDLSEGLEYLALPCPLDDGDAEIALTAMRTGNLADLHDLPFSPIGTLDLATHGGGGLSYLVLSGQQRGKVWASGPEGSSPAFDFSDYTPHGSFSWYEAWLDEPGWLPRKARG